MHKQNPEAVANALQRANEARLPPLHHAARHGTEPKAIAHLIAWGTDPNALAPPIQRRLRNERGTTPLHLAARNTSPAREAILTVLLAMGASPTVQDHGEEGSGGRQALHYLMRHSPNVRDVSLLVEAEAVRQGLFSILMDEYVRRQVTVVSDDTEATALHVAAQFGADFHVLNTLIWYGFSPDARNSDGLTPLMLAAWNTTDEDVFFLLLDTSEKPCEPSSAGLTIPALLAQNDALQGFDPTGVTETPLEAYRARCPA